LSGYRVYLGSQPIRRFIARRQLCKYATILQKLLGSRPHVTMEIHLEGVFYVVRPDAISRQLPVVRYSLQEFSTVIGSRQPREFSA
jgi:hypothetical protein